MESDRSRSPIAGLDQNEIYTVSRLNREARRLLGSHFLSIWVEGEISNLARPSSGHLYFTLKDREAQIRCAMFRTQQRQLKFQPMDGCLVLVRAQVSLYEVRGDYQLVVDFMEEAGDGALRRAFEELKQKLSDQGLFDADRKQPIPVFPDRIGVISSPTGAAIRDILSVLKRRFPAIRVVVYPVAVQGNQAQYEIVNAIQTAEMRGECKVLLLARGGGSLEDLWPFNEQSVALAISRCSIPIISAVGHETDFTIADFVADLRAPTPSVAAESVSPDQVEWLQKFEAMEQRIAQFIIDRIENQRKFIHWTIRRLQQVHPGKNLQDRAQRMDELELRLYRAVQNMMDRLSAQVSARSAQLNGCSPRAKINLLRSHQAQMKQRLIQAVRRSLEQKEQGLSKLTHTLNAVSPLATLSRGYAIASRQQDGTILRSCKDIKVGEIVETRLSLGRLICSVTDTRED